MDCECEKKIEKVGQVTAEEKDEIQRLFNRKLALKELVMVFEEKNAQNLQVDTVLQEKAAQDISETTQKVQGWWDRMAQKYQWKNIPGGGWRINFKTCEIFLEYLDEFKRMG